ncbi:protein of unknown function [Roseivivax marinus]|uniref:DUF898 family protein n=1 Tax=Roseivivax marinus TaxID=1379903 RepID=UPI0008C8058C|nr:DUF898 family protein [Roseivivax marinus]SEL86214.1 protein of unknown function [Roseivivax marinus]
MTDTPPPHPAEAPPPLPPRAAGPRYTGAPYPIFMLGLKTGLLTVLTLGIYRFWAKTRVRRYIWSSVELDGDRFEYTGTGVEKLLGFLLAVVILAVYVGLIQIGLFYFGLTLWTEPETRVEVLARSVAFLLTGAAVLPFVQFAIYRARRYRLARTRWRGIRFGMDKAAWGYAVRALGYMALTGVTLGLLLPLQTFRLTRYMTDRSWFGDTRFRQEGHWTALYGAMRQIFYAVAFGAAAALITYLLEWPLLPPLALPATGIWLVFGLFVYRVRSFAYLASHTVLDGHAGLTASPSVKTIFTRYALGSLAIGLVSSVVFGVLGGAIAIIAGGAGQMAGEDGALVGLVVAALPAMMVYLLGFVFIGAATLALISQPVLAHYVTTLTVSDADALGAVQQRTGDRGADAEGFADALDLGGAF